jgi:hypothetical protein
MDILISWWDTVYYSMMGGSPLLMFLFGWEIFLAPIGFGIAIIGGLLSTIFGRS